LIEEMFCVTDDKPADSWRAFGVTVLC